jgi:hypothetical protein
MSAVAALLTVPAKAITVANGSPAGSALISPFAPTFTGADQPFAVNLSGVVMVYGSGVGSCTGALLPDGTSILTAAHCLQGAIGSNVVFSGSNGLVSYAAASFVIDPHYDGSPTDGSDLAIIHLGAPAPAFATSYQLDLQPATLGLPDVFAGYGYGGTGTTGYNGSNYAFGNLRAGENELLEAGNQYDSSLSPGVLLGQFYESGVPATNALAMAHPFSASDEVDIAPGDSGGPVFQAVGGVMEIVGVNDFIGCATAGCTANSSFGDLFGVTAVEPNLTFIESNSAIAPEPGTIWLILAALLGCLIMRMRRFVSLTLRPAVASSPTEYREKAKAIR